MPIKRCAFSVIAVFIFVFSFDIIHGLLLSSTYQSTSNLWREHEESMQYFSYMLFSQLFFSIAITIAFSRLCKGNLVDGLRFGLFVGLILSSTKLSTYFYMPIPLILTIAWMVFAIIKSTSVGILLGLIYKK